MKVASTAMKLYEATKKNIFLTTNYDPQVRSEIKIMDVSRIILIKQKGKGRKQDKKKGKGKTWKDGIKVHYNGRTCFRGWGECCKNIFMHRDKK